MSNPISKRDMTIAAGIAVVRFENSKPLFLLLRNGGFWEFPKGRQEDGEELLDTAIRETCEETSLTPENLKFTWGKANKRTDKYKKGKKYVVYFIAQTDIKDITLPVNAESGVVEHQEWKWMSYEDAQAVFNERLNKILDWANKMIK